MTEDQITELVQNLIAEQEPDCSEESVEELGRIFERLGYDRSVQNGIYYPNALKDVGGKMSIKGVYAGGFPVGAVVHSTDGRQNNGEASARYGIETGMTYFVIGRTGKVYQNFSLHQWGSHAGPTRHPTLGSSLSTKFVGIEVVAAGIVKKIDDNRYRPYYNTSGKPEDDFTSDQVRYREAIGTPDQMGHQKAGYYHRFSEAQEASLIDLLKWMRQAVPALFKYENVLGHDEIAVNKKGKYVRKNDPGGALSLPMKEFREKLEGEAVYWSAMQSGRGLEDV